MIEQNKNKAIFFDRDGVVNYRIVGDYVRHYREFKFMPDFLEFFPRAKNAGYLAIIISNQQGVGKKLMTEEELSEVHAQMQSELNEKFGFSFDDIYTCEALAAENSPMRKPAPGMILAAIKKWNIDPAQSWMIGDSPSDVIAGKAAGVKTILLSPDKNIVIPDADYVFRGFGEAELFIF